MAPRTPKVALFVLDATRNPERSRGPKATRPRATVLERATGAHHPTFGDRGEGVEDPRYGP